MNTDERRLFLAIVDQLQRVDDLLIIFANRHRALLEVLIAKDLITAEELRAAIAEREAARAVDDSLEPIWVERQRAREELRRLLSGENIDE